MRPEGFPSRVRLRRRREFLRVQKGGRKLHSENFLVFAASNEGESSLTGLPPSRVGITVTRKVGNAVTRNRIKRLVREAFRRHRTEFPAGYDLVFVAKRGRVPASYVAVETDVQAVARCLRGRA